MQSFYHYRKIPKFTLKIIQKENRKNSLPIYIIIIIKININNYINNKLYKDILYILYI